MGNRKPSNIVLVLLLLFFTIIVLLLIIFILNYCLSINLLEKDSFSYEIIKLTVATFPGMTVAYFGILSANKNEKIGAKIEWYNEIILHKVLPSLDNYFNFVEKNYDQLSKDNRTKENEAKRIREENLYALKSIMIFDTEGKIKEEIMKKITEVQDQYRIFSATSEDKRLALNNINDLRTSTYAALYKMINIFYLK